jgi:NAD(P)H-dependent flavin oxidoreductase YrpB (nitropropane dioxygenase family)
MQTKIAEMLGVEFPVCAISHCRDVVAAVSNAGGLGSFGVVAHSPHRPATVRSRSLTGRPARMLRADWTTEWERDDSPDPLGMPLQGTLIVDPQARINRAAAQPDSKSRELATYDGVDR